MYVGMSVRLGLNVVAHAKFFFLNSFSRRYLQRARLGARMSSAHVLRVKKLYRHSLKNLLNWCVHRDLWIKKGFDLRAEFEARAC